MRGLSVQRCLAVILSAVVCASPALPVIAQGTPPPAPPPPIGHVAPAAAGALALPAAAQAVLYDQVNSANGSFILSQNSTDNQYDTQAADDFFVNLGSNSWQITAVEVVGRFTGGSGPASVTTATVEIFADAGGLPGYRLFAQTVQPISGTAATGNFFLPLSPPVRIASNGTYWVAVQAFQTTSWYWYWDERGTQSQSASAWKNPSNGFSTGCLNWTALNQCFQNEGPDLLFRLYGTTSANQVTPVLLSLNPGSAINRAFTLAAHGIGFANGATIDWTLGATQHISTTLSSSTNLSAAILAAQVPGPYGGTVSVTVTNPGPCGGSCTSNALTFTLVNRTFLPLVRR